MRSICGIAGPVFAFTSEGWPGFMLMGRGFINQLSLKTGETSMQIIKNMTKLIL